MLASQNFLVHNYQSFDEIRLHVYWIHRKLGSQYSENNEIGIEMWILHKYCAT